jgi:hypothetical protein
MAIVVPEAVRKSAVPEREDAGNYLLRRDCPTPEIRIHFRFQEAYQLRIHGVVPVTDAEDDETFLTKLAAKCSHEPFAMPDFHHEDDVGPLNEIGRNRCLRVWTRACREGLNTRTGRKVNFGRGTAPAIPATDKE